MTFMFPIHEPALKTSAKIKRDYVFDGCVCKDTERKKESERGQFGSETDRQLLITLLLGVHTKLL